MSDEPRKDVVCHDKYSSFVHTPHLDPLRREAITFEPAWPTTATSSASTAWPARWATCTRPRCYAGDRGELCDLRADPEELVNRFDRPKYRDWQQALRAAIARFLIRYPLPPQPGRNHFFG